ncbi:MAG: hypothetical protein E7160_01745 [Firmicutes bacterium]|nr:hypothetical protein [Bacillota bacterium]
MNFIKKNKFTIVAIIVFLIIVMLLVQVKNIFFPSEGGAIYGNRLENIDEVKIDNNKKQAISKNITKDGIAKKATIRISGRIIEVSVVVNEEASVDSSKNLANKVVEKLTDDEKKYYDIQVFIEKSNNTSNFPIIGYKHHGKDNFSWTKNR